MYITNAMIVISMSVVKDHWSSNLINLEIVPVVSLFCIAIIASNSTITCHRFSTAGGDPLVHLASNPVFMPNFPGWAFFKVVSFELTHAV